MQKLSWKSIQEQFPKYTTKYKNEFKELFTKSGKAELSVEDIDNYLNTETSLIAYKIGGYTRYFNDTAGRTLGRVEVADNGDSQCYDTGGSLLGMVIGGQTFASNGVLLSPQDILSSLLVNENRVQASKNSFKNLVNWFKSASYESETSKSKIIGDYEVQLNEVYFEENNKRSYDFSEVSLWPIKYTEGKSGKLPSREPIKVKKFYDMLEAEETYNKINTEEDFNLLAGKQAATWLVKINVADIFIDAGGLDLVGDEEALRNFRDSLVSKLKRYEFLIVEKLGADKKQEFSKFIQELSLIEDSEDLNVIWNALYTWANDNRVWIETINKQAATEQVLYIDYAGGKFESWFYSEGDRYRFMESYDIDEIIRKAKRQEFNKFILTEEAKMFRRSDKKADIYPTQMEEALGLQPGELYGKDEVYEEPEGTVEYKGYTIELSFEQSGSVYPFKAFVMGIGTARGKDEAEAINWMKKKIDSKTGSKKADAPTQSTLFDINTVDEVINRLNIELEAPYRSIQKSTLGGAENVSIIATISLDSKETWSNGILQNSRYMMFYSYRDGTIEQFSKNYTIEPKFRKTKAKNVDELLYKLNSYFGTAQGFERNPNLKKANKLVKDVPEDFTFTNNDIEVKSLNQEFNTNYDSFFIKVSEGEYETIYGMCGIVPFKTVSVYEVYQNKTTNKQANESQELFEMYEDAMHGDISTQKFLEELFEMSWETISSNAYFLTSNKWQEGINLLKEMRNEPVEKQAYKALKLKWIPTLKKFSTDRIEDRPILRQLQKEAGLPVTGYITEQEYDALLRAASVYGLAIETESSETIASAKQATLSEEEIDAFIKEEIEKQIELNSKSVTLGLTKKEQGEWSKRYDFLRESRYMTNEEMEKYMQESNRKESNLRQADERLIDPHMHVPESYSPLYEERNPNPAEWTSYSMQDIEYVDPLWDESTGEEIEVKQPSKYIPKKKQRGKYNLHEIVMTPEGRGRVVMKQVDFQPFSYTVALTGKDEVALVEEKDIQRLASINKQAKRNDARYYATVQLELWIDGDSLEYDDEIEKIRKSNATEDEKIKLAKERVESLIELAVDSLRVDSEYSGVSVNHIQLQDKEIDPKHDNIDYVSLVTEDTYGKELDEEDLEKESSLTKMSYIEKKEDGYYVRSEKGKNLGGPYSSRDEAENRLKDVHYFSHQGNEIANVSDDILKDTKDAISSWEFNDLIEEVFVVDAWRRDRYFDTFRNVPYGTVIIYTNEEANELIEVLQKLLPQYFLEPISYYAIGVYPKGDTSYEDMEEDHIKGSKKSAKSVGWLRDKFLNKIDKIADVAAEVNDEFKKEREDGEGRGISLIDYYTTGRYHEIERPLSEDAITKSQAEKLMEDLVYQFKTELFAIYNISSTKADDVVEEPKGVSMKDIEDLEEETEKESAIGKEIEFYPMDSIGTGYPSTQYLKDIVEPVKQPEGKYLSY